MLKKLEFLGEAIEDLHNSCGRETEGEVMFQIGVLKERYENLIKELMNKFESIDINEEKK